MFSFVNGLCNPLFKSLGLCFPHVAGRFESPLKVEKGPWCVQALHRYTFVTVHSNFTVSNGV